MSEVSSRFVRTCIRTVQISMLFVCPKTVRKGCVLPQHQAKAREGKRVGAVAFAGDQVVVVKFRIRSRLGWCQSPYVILKLKNISKFLRKQTDWFVCCKIINISVFYKKEYFFRWFQYGSQVSLTLLPQPGLGFRCRREFPASERYMLRCMIGKGRRCNRNMHLRVMHGCAVKACKFEPVVAC